MSKSPPMTSRIRPEMTGSGLPKTRKNKPYAPSEISIRPVREQIRGLPDRAAIEHLIYLVEEMSGTKKEFMDVMSRLGVSASLAKIYVYLKKRAPHPVSMDQLVAVTTRDPANPPPEESARLQILYLRRALPENEKIVTVWGQGYRMEIDCPAAAS